MDEDERKVSQWLPCVEGEIGYCYEASVEELWPGLKSVLEEFAEVFEEPRALPPQRELDHKISLKEGLETVNMRPYKYAAQQKDAIEAMIEEMLQSGVI